MDISKPKALELARDMHRGGVERDLARELGRLFEDARLSAELQAQGEPSADVFAVIPPSITQANSLTPLSDAAPLPGDHEERRSEMRLAFAVGLIASLAAAAYFFR